MIEDLTPCQPRVRWVVPRLNPRSASLRYRCIYPMTEIKRAGRDIEFWQEGEPIDAGLTLVFEGWAVFPTVNSAALAEELVCLAERAAQLGARVIVDNCDNQFACVSEIEGWKLGLDMLRRLARVAQTMVCCSVALSEVLREELGSELKFVVIDDPLELSLLLPSDTFFKRVLSPGRKIAWARAALLGLKLAANRISGRSSLIWFGSHGNAFSPGGMLDLKPLLPLLTRINSQHPISLSVVSNQKQKFEDHFKGLAFPTHYLEWNRVSFHAILKMHQIALIPSVDNAFTRCKSSNRLTLASHHGLAVLADAMPAYLPYEQVVALGDWEKNLTSLLAKPQLRQQRIAAAQQFVRARNGLAEIARQWECLFYAGSNQA